MKCTHCEFHTADSSDPEFCQSCYNHIEDLAAGKVDTSGETMVARMDGLVGLKRLSRASLSPKTELAGFLSIMNPEWSQEKVMRMVVELMD